MHTAGFIYSLYRHFSFCDPLSCASSPPEITRLYTLYPDEELSFTFDLQLNSCNIYFFPKNDHEQSYFISRLVRRGRLQEGLYRFDCTGFDLQKPCGIFNKAVQMSCEGRFEIRDQNDDMALEVELVISK